MKALSGAELPHKPAKPCCVLFTIYPCIAYSVFDMRGRQKLFTFIANDPVGLPQNRKGTHRACAHCRKRKRRCTHGPKASRHPETQPGDVQISNTASPPSVHEEIVSTSPGCTVAVQQNTQPHASGPRIDSESWFVGEMDPASAFWTATGSSSPSPLRRHDVGIWLSPDKTCSELATKKPKSGESHFKPLISTGLLPYLQEKCSVLPSPGDMEGLLWIYLENIHPIFPVLDYDAYRMMPGTSPDKIILSQSICLAASLDRKAKQFLNIPTINTSRSDFSLSLTDAITTSIAVGLVKDKLVLIQALSLTSLFTQFSGDRQESAELLYRAICHAHTIGLHHPSHPVTQHEHIYNRMFCCLYALDMLNAACLGRPVQLHRRDFGRDLASSIAAQEGCFQLFLRTIVLMERVIEIYRPSEIGIWNGPFPSFEDLLQEVGTSDTPVHLIGNVTSTERLSQTLIKVIATIEVLYHAVAILSCRLVTPEGVSQSSESNLRQSLSVSRVTSIVGDEFHNELSSFPIIPYAVALSLRVSYHNLQRSKVPIFQARARKQLVANCLILREMGEVFVYASMMANLGEYLVSEVDKQNQDRGSGTRGNSNNDLTRRHADILTG